MKESEVKIFISYSHKDETFKEELVAHLAALDSGNGGTTSWHDRKIMAGSDWEDAIDSRLENSNVILILVSSDFIASKYCYGKELKKALEKHELGQARVVPIIVRACHWKNTDFSHLQALPKDGKPVSQWTYRDEAWVDVVVGIGGIINTFQREDSKRDHNEKSTRKISGVGGAYAIAKKGRITNRDLVYDRLLRPNGQQRQLISILWPDREKAIIECGTECFWSAIGWAPKEGDVGKIWGVMKHFYDGDEVYLMEFNYSQQSVFLAIQTTGVDLVD